MDKEGNHEVFFTGHQTFFSIAYRHHKHVERLVSEREARKVKDDRDVDYVCEKNAAIQRSAMVSVIFSALTLEAFINNYAIERFSRSYFDNHLDKLNPVSKWVLVPKLITGKAIDTDGQPYERLKKLFKLRDRLVHYKTKRKKVSEMVLGEDWVTENHSEDAILTVESVLNELSTIDPVAEAGWTESAKYYPYA